MNGAKTFSFCMYIARLGRYIRQPTVAREATLKGGKAELDRKICASVWQPAVTENEQESSNRELMLSFPGGGSTLGTLASEPARQRTSFSG